MSNVESVENVEQNEDQKGTWEIVQQIHIDQPFMDQIVAAYLSARAQMDKKGTKLVHKEYVSTSKGHGIQVRVFDRNVCIEKKRRIEA